MQWKLQRLRKAVEWRLLLYMEERDSSIIPEKQTGISSGR